MHTWRRALTALCLAGSLVAGGAFLVSAQEGATIAPSQGESGPMSPRVGAQTILAQLQFTLSEGALAALASDDVPDVAAYVVNMLEGENGENYRQLEGYESDPYGLIQYLEDLTGKSADELAQGDLEATAASESESAEVRAFAHVLLAHRSLTGGAPADAALLQEVAEHIKEAHSLVLGGVSE